MAKSLTPKQHDDLLTDLRRVGRGCIGEGFLVLLRAANPRLAAMDEQVLLARLLHIEGAREIGSTISSVEMDSIMQYLEHGSRG